MSCSTTVQVVTLTLVTLLLPGNAIQAAEGQPLSHPAMRPLPTASTRPLAEGPSFFVDSTSKGDDANDGSQLHPWKTIAHATRQLKPGDTLYLRGGTYYERVFLSQSGTAAKPIAICGYPGELAILDGGFREFHDSPATSWHPLESGAAGEFVSTKTYPQVDDRQVPHQFLPTAWEPMWGVETQRPIALGHFADSMVPLHGYRTVGDLRAKSEFWPAAAKDADRDAGPYCGPGLWFNRETGRVHIRLSHNRLAGLGDRAYRGETDPRKLPLIVALGFGAEVLRISGIQHVQIRDLVLRGATGSPMIHLYGSENIDFDHLTIFGGFPALLVNASKEIRVTHSAFRGLAAPWTGRGHMKYRGTASYQVIFQNSQPGNENIEFGWCEFTDDHDCAFFRFVKNLQFHHNYVDNFNDDGLEFGPKRRNHSMYVYQNRIGACLGMFQQHELEKDESPLDHDPNSGVFVYRNVLDPRAGVYYAMPTKDEPSGEYLHAEGVLVGDHGSPIYPVMRFYHNTIIRKAPVFRDYFLFGLGAVGIHNSERHVFNNILVQLEGAPGLGLGAASNLREGGNFLWSLAPSSAGDVDPFAKFRASKLFTESKQYFEPGWTTQDHWADPAFVNLKLTDLPKMDLRLQPSSPAINAGAPIPSEWPDVLRDIDPDQPDVGALPHGTKPWGVGVDGRIPLYGATATK
ncbi:MAG: hypothetical protein JWN70_3227 [Planctomycetaceae bacterium]|nr:hypothetical protein [Planctomycetaceae bacterium]